MDLPNNSDMGSAHGKGDHQCNDGCVRADHLVQQAIAMSERILATADKDAITAITQGKAIHPDELAMLGSCQVLAKLADRAGHGGALQDIDKKDAAGVRAQVDESLHWLALLYSEAYRIHNGRKGKVTLTGVFRDE